MGRCENVSMSENELSVHERQIIFLMELNKANAFSHFLIVRNGKISNKNEAKREIEHNLLQKLNIVAQSR